MQHSTLRPLTSSALPPHGEGDLVSESVRAHVWQQQLVEEHRALSSSDYASDSTSATHSDDSKQGPSDFGSWMQGPRASVGSLMHGTGCCKPCAWYWKAGGCQNGRDCQHCHMCSSGEIKARRKAKLGARRDTKPCAAEASEQGGCDAEDESRKNKGWSSDEESRTSTMSSMPAMVDVPEPAVLAPPPGLDWPSSSQPRALAVEVPHDVPPALLSPLVSPAAAASLPSPASPAAALSLPPAPPLSPLPGAPGVAAAGSVPQFAAAPIASAGSLLHGTGLCRPCAWFWKPQGCANGQECQHCHMCSQGALRARKKAARALKVLAEPLKEQLAAYQMQEEQRLQTQQHDGRQLGTSGSVSPELAAGQPAYLSGPAPVHLPLFYSRDFNEEAEVEVQTGLPRSPQPVVAYCAADVSTGEPSEPSIVGTTLGADSVAPVPNHRADAVATGPNSLPLSPPSLPSVGSRLHGTGRCKPCAWLWKAQGCANGSECQHCHACPVGEIKARRKAKFAVVRTDGEQMELRAEPNTEALTEGSAVGGA